MKAIALLMAGSLLFVSGCGATDEPKEKETPEVESKVELEETGNSTEETKAEETVTEDTTTEVTEEEPTEEETVAESSPSTEVSTGPSLGEEQALGKAESYLSFSAFSKKGLGEQLKFEGFEQGEIDYALSQIEVDWSEQAVKKAKDYLNVSDFSKASLIEQLKFEGFTEEEAQAGVKGAGY